MRNAGEEQHVMLAEGPERDGASQHQLVVALVVREGGEPERPRGKQLCVGAGHPGRRGSPFPAVEIDPERGEEVRGGPLRGGQVPGGALSIVEVCDLLAPVQVHGRVRPVQVDGGLPPVLVDGRTHGCVQGRPSWATSSAGRGRVPLAELGFGRAGVWPAPPGIGWWVMVLPSTSWRGCGDDDAAVLGFRIKDGVQSVGARARDQALDQREVHVADHLGLPFRHAAERAVAHPDGASIVMPGLEAVLGQRALQSQPLAGALGIIGPVPLTEVGAQLPGGVIQRRPGPATAVSRDRLDQLPLPDDYADLVVACSAFTPAPGHGGEAGLAEMERVCRPGGRTAIIWPNHLDWLAARGYQYVSFPGPMSVQFGSYREAVELASIFCPKAAEEVRRRGRRTVPFEVLGINPPRDLAFKVLAQ